MNKTNQVPSLLWCLSLMSRMGDVVLSSHRQQWAVYLERDICLPDLKAILHAITFPTIWSLLNSEKYIKSITGSKLALFP